MDEESSFARVLQHSKLSKEVFDVTAIAHVIVNLEQMSYVRIPTPQNSNTHIYSHKVPLLQPFSSSPRDYERYNSLTRLKTRNIWRSAGSYSARRGKNCMPEIHLGL